MQIHIEATQLDPYDAGGISETCPDSGANIACPTITAALLQSRQVLIMCYQCTYLRQCSVCETRSYGCR